MKTFNKIIAAGVLILSGLLLYSNTYEGSFHFDDYVYIVENYKIRDLSDMKAVWMSNSIPSRFITMLSFALNYHFHGDEVFGYHLVNNVLHVINALLVFWFCGMLFQTPALVEKTDRKKVLWIAFFSALLFLVHPIQTQAVNYLCQRFAVLATLFYCLTLSLYLKARLSDSLKWKTGLFCLAGISAAVGMLTKEIMITLPGSILLIEALFFKHRLDKKTLKKFFIGFLIVLPILLIIPYYYSFRILNILSVETDSFSHLGDKITSLSYLATQPRVLTRYLTLFVFPVGQNLLYDFPTTKNIFELYSLISVFILAGLIAIAFSLRRKHPLVSFGIFWFFITLIIESSVIPLKQVIFEHRTYLPSVGICIMIVYVSSIFLKNLKQMIIVLVSVMVIFGVLTFMRNTVWRTEVSLWKDVLSKSPNHITAATHLATGYMKEGDDNKALEYYTRAIEIDPQYAQSYNNRANVYLKTAQLDKAFNDYNRALDLDDQLARTYANRGVLYSMTKNLDGALSDLTKAIELEDENPQNYLNRANVYIKINQSDKALEDLLKAVEFNPYYVTALYKIGNIYSVVGDYEKALVYFDRALKIDPQMAKVYYNRSLVYWKIRQDKRALDDALKAQEFGFQMDQAYIDGLKKSVNKEF